MEGYQNPNLSAEERARDLLSRMSVREKVGQLTQSLYGFHCYVKNGQELGLSENFCREVDRFGGIGAIYGVFRADPWAEKDFSSGLNGKEMIRVRNMMQRYAITHSRFGIPILFSSEAAHGHQCLGGYLLPVNLASAATFSPSLVGDAFGVCGQQMRSTGVDLAFASVLDVARDPRWGRCEESFGEDPYLASEMAKAVVTALRESGVDVVAKHFCAQGDSAGGVNSGAARIGMRELREIHLPPVRASIEAGAAMIMSTYNEIDGVYCTASRELNTDLLRGEYHFEGSVMSDALAVDLLDAITGDRVRSVALAFHAGVDMGLLDHSFERLEEAVRLGYVSEEKLDVSVSRILRLKLERGLFDDPYLPENVDPMGFTCDLYGQSERLSEESAVLLKNSGGILPLPEEAAQILAVGGPNADRIYRQCGDYTPPLRKGSYVTVLGGIRDYVAEHCPQTRVISLPEIPLFEASEMSVADAILKSHSADTVIAVLGGSSDRYGGSRSNANGQVEEQSCIAMDCGEGIDCARLSLAGGQLALLRALKESGKRVITVMICGRPYAMEEIEAYSDAILCCFYPGPMGGRAIARLLFGAISPGGRLPISLPDTAGQVPVFYNYKQSYRAMRYYDLAQKPHYSFGYGLTYTTFSYTLLSAPEEASREITFEVKNTGERAAYAVPQLYLRRLQGVVTSRVRELCGFEKIYLRSGERRCVTIRIPERSLCQWDASMREVCPTGEIEWFLSDGGQEFLTGKFFV